ncbi:hypothetical protein [Aeromonas enterica]|jgi:hypothetical protein
MRIYCRNNAGEFVHMADDSLCKAACQALDSGANFYYELPPILAVGVLAERPSAVAAIERVLLEPYRLYRNGVLVAMGAMIADRVQVEAFINNIRQRAAAKREAQDIVETWAQLQEHE